MQLTEVYNQLHQAHVEATARKDMEGIAAVARGYDELLNHAPDDIGVLFAAATAHMQLGKNGLAIILFQKAQTIQNLPEIWNNMGTAYKAENRNKEARECWEKALEVREDADYINNMATLYVNEGDPAEGLKWAERGLAINPNHSRLHWNHALLLLEMGKWKEGFAEYEYGMLSMDRPERVYSAPPEAVPYWDGTTGKRVVVYGEQGIGDEIMFASAIPDLMRDCEVVFDCHPRLLNAFKRSFGIPCYPTRKDNKIEWVRGERLDAKVAIGSLFKHYRSGGQFPRTAYLKADPKLVDHYRGELAKAGPGPYVGIGWKAGSKSTRDDLRSLKLGAFAPIYTQGGTFVSLQYTEGSKDKCERHLANTGVHIHHWAEVVETGMDPENRFIGYDYDHTLALIEALDLTILPNTTAVHAAGALGKECWTITPSAPAWRYQLTGDSMPMYESVRQFRGADAIERIAGEYSIYRRAWAEPARAAAG